MSPEAQRIAIAEACGWKWRKATWVERLCYLDTVKVVTTRPDGVEICGYIPDYINDLNAMHEAEETLDRGQRQAFIRNLEEIAGAMATDEWDCVHATPAQRARAFLKTLNIQVD